MAPSAQPRCAALCASWLSLPLCGIFPKNRLPRALPVADGPALPAVLCNTAEYTITLSKLMHCLGRLTTALSVLQVFDQVDLDNHYALWPADKLEYSAVGLDVG